MAIKSCLVDQTLIKIHSIAVRYIVKGLSDAKIQKGTLENNIQRLQVDHDNAKLLASGLASIEELSIEFSESQTNMVFVNCSDSHRAGLEKFLFEKEIIVSNLERGRLVCHLGIEEKDILFVIDTFKDYFK